MNKIAVLGAGGWGTALALALLRAGNAPLLWARRSEYAADLQKNRENHLYLPNVPLPEELVITADLSLAASADWAMIVTPASAVPSLLQQLPRTLGLVLCAKGLAPDGHLLSHIAAQMGFERVAVLSGPNHAEEISLGLPAATVVAGQHNLIQTVQQSLHSSSLRVYTSSDVLGVELGGVLKNVIAVAAGLADGLHVGDNAKAALITRGLLEMNRYMVAKGALPETVYGLSGLGDLIATATSVHSRNRAAGEALARGESPKGLVEGFRTAVLLHEWAEHQGFDLPVTTAVAKVYGGQWTPQRAIEMLMDRSVGSENACIDMPKK